jgi:RNA polymerase primary sigma factor
MIDFDSEFDGEEQPVKERTVHSLPTSYPCMKRLLTADEEIDLCQRAQVGDELARERMMEANLRLVMAIARRYNGRSMTYEDIVQEGVIGLLQAIIKFDSGRGNRFSTYATYWIRQSIVRAIEKTDRMIRLPTYGCNAEKKVRVAEQELAHELGRLPTVEEVAARTEFSKSIVRALIHFTNEPLSLDAMFGEDLDNSMKEILQDEEAVDPLESVIRQSGIASLEELLDCLKPRERAIIECRYGLRDGRAWTLRECADIFELSREGVRQIWLRAMRKLKVRAAKLRKADPDLAYSADLLA